MHGADRAYHASRDRLLQYSDSATPLGSKPKVVSYVLYSRREEQAIQNFRDTPPRQREATDGYGLLR
jgi:hypothetical protein